MRLGAWLAMAFGCALTASACSGGYPLPPTRCDDWCDVTKGLSCAQFYNPAGCVSNCEQANTDAEACRTEFEAVLSCFRKDPSAVEAQCRFYSEPPPPCQAEKDALALCVGSQFIDGRVNE
jgi:hypothetical protein